MEHSMHPGGMEGDHLYSHNHGQYNVYHSTHQETSSSSADYDSHVSQITIPSYVSSPTTPQTPFSPRAMAIQQLKRAASVREAAGKKEEQPSQHLQTSSSDAGHSGSLHSPGGSSASQGMSPSMSRAPSIKRLGLERSASDAARRLAMAKLTGEKVPAPPEYIMPKTPLPVGPLPTLADLQARHEQRLGLASPEPLPSNSGASPPHGLSRNPSAASTALSRQLSSASARIAPSNLSRNPSFARSLAGGAQSPAPPSAEQGNPEVTEDEESKQRRTDERQEARSNLIRKLSRGRLAGAAATAGIKERHAHATAQGANEEVGSTSSPASTIQRRPSLADVLARADSRNRGRSQTPETPSRNNNQESEFGPQQILLPTPDSASRVPAFGSPISTNSASPSASSLRKAANLRQYDHIPIPPTPASGSTITSHSNTPSTSSLISPGGGPASAHESMYSVVSNFRSYRHTMERDRDSAIARMEMEDAFEFDVAALEAARSIVATTAFTGGGKQKLHGHHPLSDDERKEELEDDPVSQGMFSNKVSTMSEDDPTLRQMHFPPVATRQQVEANFRTSPRLSPPTQTSVLDSSDSPKPVSDFLSAKPDYHRRPSESTETSSHSARNRAIGSMPQTPKSNSPISPFTFSPVRASPPEATTGPLNGQPSRQLDSSQPTYYPDAAESTTQQQSQNEQLSPFLRHHQKEPNGDFPISVMTSRTSTSTYPDFTTLAIQDQVPMPEAKFMPINKHFVVEEPGVPAQVAPPLPNKNIFAHVGPRANHERASHAQDQPSKEVRSVEEVHDEEDNNAGPTSEYRFPTASSRGRRPGSISSSNDHHDDNLNSMISQLEAMQASGASEWPLQATNLPSPRTTFGKSDFEQQNKMLPRQPPQQVFPQANLPFHASHAAPSAQQLETKPMSLTHLASQLRQPLSESNGINNASPQASPPQNKRVPQEERQTPVHGLVRQHAVGGVGHVSHESAAEVLNFVNDKPAYNSGASAENDSVPSLARTGTGSSSSGFSTRSDNAFAVTAIAVAPSQTKEQVLSRLSDLLAAHKQHPLKKPSALEHPPRHLLLHSAVLQVVNSNTVKDRYLFLFNDILVIAKPIIEEDASGDPLVPNLDTKFLVKSIVELPKLKLTAQTTDIGEDPVQKRKHPLLLTFVDRFANDPRKAVNALVAKAGLSNDPPTIANLLFRNPELNRSQLGAFLAHKDQKPVLKAYCDRFRLAGIRIEDALRVFIGSLRLPNDYTAAEYMLGVFASQWLTSNPGTGMTNDGVFATKLVLSMMELNDALHSGIDDEATAAGNLFSFPNSAITVDDFIAAFRLKDPHGALPDEHLTRIYLSIRKDRLQQAADNAIVGGISEIEVVIHPSKLPNRLTYRTASENISLTIPKIDPKFAIKLVGQDLRFEPPVLTFARSRTATFRVTPMALGSKAMLFIRLGQNAHLYSNLPINKTFSVERAFMNHTFQIAFVNHLGVKRKYLFSLNSLESKYSWVDTLRTKIENSPIDQPDTPRPARLTEAVSLQVLRDALIAPDEPAPTLANKPALYSGRPGFTTPPNSRGRSAAGGTSGLQRSSSFSKTYAHGQGKAETDLNDQRRPSGTNLSLLAPLSMRRGSRDDDKGAQQQPQLQHHKTGHEIVMAVRQNSLMPLVLGFVSAGVEGLDAMPRKPIYPEPAQVHPTPLRARGTGRFQNL